MVTFSLSQLKDIEEMMLDDCLLADAEITICPAEKVVTLAWSRGGGRGLLQLSRKVSFYDIGRCRVDALGVAARRGSKEFGGSS